MQNPSIRLVLDLHRDALEKDGRQFRPLVQVDGVSAAQLMLVVGTDISRQSHQNWQENLSLALKLQVQLERIAPGIMRPVNLRAQRFNQDLSPGALLVEVGAAGNTHEEAQKAAQILAKALIFLSKGTDG
jgi:stage II sporulation protein P